jgi:hypothetical protein
VCSDVPTNFPEHFSVPTDTAGLEGCRLDMSSATSNKTDTMHFNTGRGCYTNKYSIWHQMMGLLVNNTSETMFNEVVISSLPWHCLRELMKS